MKTNQNITDITKPVAAVLIVWLALVFFLGALGAFTGSPGSPPVAVLFGVVVPIAFFLVTFQVSHAFRDFVLGFDLRLAAGIQAWRFAGLGFLALYANGVLPAVFAWPAGIGDIAIGLTAPWVMRALIQRPGFAASKRFVNWNLFGILDLVVAVSSGGLNALLAHGFPGEITTRPMSELPLVLIPGYFVPLFVMLHLTALFQARRPAVLPAAVSSTPAPSSV
jgi:hypothetical protein